MTERTDSHKLAELGARAVAAGWTLSKVHDDAGHYYLASRWGMHKSLPDLAAVEKFFDQVGGRHG